MSSAPSSQSQGCLQALWVCGLHTGVHIRATGGLLNADLLAPLQKPQKIRRLVAPSSALSLED